MTQPARVMKPHSPHEDGLRDPHAEVLHPRDEAEGVDAHAVAHALVRLARPAAAAVHSSG